VEYFANRDKMVLAEAKKLEKEVDIWLKGVQQKDMFE
jgi:hypothetical protein